MESYVLDWLQLIFRWLHVITGVAWIGASFYFVWLDNHLEDPPRWKKDKGIKGDLWAIHGGGIYEVGKYQLAPEKMPSTLHWFKWEAYSTWLTGMVLLILIFYIGAESYLIDPAKADLSVARAVSYGLGAIALSWIAYELLCATALAKNGYLLGLILMIIAIGLSWFLTSVFSGRGAFIHMGAIIGTIMAGNVFQVIIPSQKALVAAIETGSEPDPSWGARAKLRSTHNNYLTLPLLFIMISNHYPMTYSGPYSWLVLLAIIAITAYARHYFNLRHRKINRPHILVVSLAGTAALAWALTPQQTASTQQSSNMEVSELEALQVVQTHCSNCHSAMPSDDMFKVAPAGAVFDTREQVLQWSDRILARAVDGQDMPFLNKTQMTDEERQLLGKWLRAQAGQK